MTDEIVLQALRQALEKEPRSAPLWMHYAELLTRAGKRGEALAALRTAAEIEGPRGRAERALIPLLRESGQLDEALVRAERLLEAGEDPDLRAEMARIERERQPAAAGDARVEPAPALVTGGEVPPESWAEQFDWSDLHVALRDVVGLEDVKRQIHLRVIAPYRQADIYRAFHREGGGGLLLYGPPGCGKTFIARATAGELGARFVSVTIHDVVDKYWGESEKAVHEIFELARRKSPTVLFFDEFDALGASRGRGDSQFWKTLVDQLLQEMDGIGSRNRDVLLFAATNAPWNVDAAFRRPGRFDRVLLVPPPDEAARVELLRRHAGRLPGGEGVDAGLLARRTQLFTGADLRALCERASERALERSLESGRVERVLPADFERTLAECKSTALEWLATARNHARYSNQAGQYDELVDYLKQVKQW